jgi:hypothetical protein
MLNSASAFNQNIAGWNVVRVDNVGLAFESMTALEDCYRKGVYTAWGATLQAAYPSWSSLCTRCVCTPRYTYMFVFTFMRAHSYKHVHIYIHTYMHTYMHTQTDMYALTYKYMHTYLHACIHTYVHACTRACNLRC